jgi:hypothetical protein
MNKDYWLEMRKSDLNRALELKEQGETLIWISYDYAMDISEYIENVETAIKTHLEEKVKD